jgi:hydroxyacylglutathione hydrolase
MTPTGVRSDPDGIHAIDTGYIRPGLAACHLIVRGGRAAVVDPGPSSAVPRLLAALEPWAWTGRTSTS